MRTNGITSAFRYHIFTSSRREHTGVSLDDASSPRQRLRQQQRAGTVQIDQVDRPSRGIRDCVDEFHSALRSDGSLGGDRHVDVARTRLPAVCERSEDTGELDIRLPRENIANRVQRIGVFPSSCAPAKGEEKHNPSLSLPDSAHRSEETDGLCGREEASESMPGHAVSSRNDSVNLKIRNVVAIDLQFARRALSSGGYRPWVGRGPVRGRRRGTPWSAASETTSSRSPTTSHESTWRRRVRL